METSDDHLVSLAGNDLLYSRQARLEQRAGLHFRMGTKMIERYPKAAITALLAILLLYVPLYDLYYFGIQSVFGHFAQDAFYYLTVAKRSTLGFFTFDGERATNGFHPLWQYTLTALFWLLKSYGSEIQLYATYMLGVGLTTLGFVFVGWSIYLITRSIYWPAWLIPGPFYMLFTVKVDNQAAHGLTYTYSPWAFMNGMESPCSVAAGGLFLYLMTKACYRDTQGDSETGIAGEMGALSAKTFLALGGCLSLVVLSRLDDVFLLLTTALFFLFVDRRSPRPIRNVVLLVLPTCVLLAGYMAFNYVTCRSLLPVSGMIKSTAGAALTGNITMSLCDLFPPLSGLIRPSYSLPEWGNTAARSSAMILPLILGLHLAVLVSGARKNNPDIFNKLKWLLPFLGYMVLKGMYNLVNVRLGSQGYWYYVLPVLLANYFVILLLWRLIPREVFRRFPVLKVGCIGFYVVLYLFTSGNSISNGSVADDGCYSLWRDRQEITSALKTAGGTMKLIDRSDGAYAYSLDIPAVCSLGYAIDYDGYIALKNGKFLDYCLQRGFNLTFEGPGAYPIEKDRYVFRRIYEHKPSGTVFYKIERPLEIAGK